MSKKDSPDAPGKNGPPASDAHASAKKKSGFISDFDMWGMNLDISGDETIDTTVRSGEKAKKPEPTQPAPKQSAPKLQPDPVTESRAKTAPITPRTVKPSGTKNPAGAATSAGIKLVNKAQSSSPRVATPKVASTHKPASTARSPSQAKATNVTRQTPANREVRQGQQRQQASRSQQPGRASASNDTGAQRDAAVFTTRDVNRHIMPQDINRVDEVQKKRRRDKVKKAASWIWFVFDMLWAAIVKLAPFLYRNKLVVGVALVSFFLGVYVGNAGRATNSTGAVNNAGVANETAQAKQLHSRPAHKVVHARKKVIAKQDKATRISASTAALEPSPAVEPSSEEAVSQQDLAPNQFSGKDIPVTDDGADADVQPASADGANGASLTDEQGSLNTAQQSPPAQGDVGQPAANAVGNIVSGSSQTQVVVTQTTPAKASIKADANASALKQLLDENLAYFNQKQWQQVIDTSNKILAIKPFTEAALINRSAAYTELGQYDLAIEDANTLIIMDKKNGVAFNNRAYAYEKAGRLKKSVIDYATACKLGVQQSCNDMQRLKKILSESQ